MVIGDGMIAKVFESYQHRNDVCIFASGVSNSREISKKKFQREFNLLIKIIKENPEKIFVYFSTCSIYDKSLISSPYIKHKKKIEKYILSAGIQYYIFRVSQALGITNNKHILINSFINKIRKKEKLILWDRSTRNLIDVDDLYKIVNFCISKRVYLNSITNVASPFAITPLEIVSFLEKVLGQKAIYEILDFGDPYTINIKKISKYLRSMGASFYLGYPKNIILKYFR